MELRNFVIAILNIFLIAEVIESNRRPPLRPPPPWRNQHQHHGRGGMPIPIHDNGFAQRRIFTGPPGPNKFPPPMRGKMPPPPGYFNKQRRPPPPYGGFNHQMRPPHNPHSGVGGPSSPHGFNNLKQSHLSMHNFHQNDHTMSPQTPPPTSPSIPTSPPTHSSQQQFYHHPQQNYQQSLQHNQQSLQQNQQPIQNQQQTPQFQQTQHHFSPNTHQGQSHQQVFQTHQHYNVSAKTQVVGSIQPSQQTAQPSQQHLTVVKPDGPVASGSSPAQQIYQFHLPPANANQANSIIQIHLSSTTESPKDAGAGKDFFTGSTFKPPFNSGFPDREYIATERPRTTQIPSLNYKNTNADKFGVYERPIIYKQPSNSKEDPRPYNNKPQSHYTKPNAALPIDITTETPYNPEPYQKQDFGQSSYKSDYEHSLTPPSKHDYGLVPSNQKQDYGLSQLAKHDYEQYKLYREYTNKYSQLDPLYHPEGEIPKSSNEEPETDLTLPERYDNSFSTNYKHDDPPAYPDITYPESKLPPPRLPVKPPRAQNRPAVQPEEILGSLGLSTNPLDHLDIVKTTNELKYKKEPLYSLPDRQIEEDEDDEQQSEGDSSPEMGYPGTSYSPEKSASKLRPVKRPPPENHITKVKGLKPPSLSAHTPDHRDDIITADSSPEFYSPKISNREDAPLSYNGYQHPHHIPTSRYPHPNDAYVHHGHDYALLSAPHGAYHGPSAAPPHYRGPSAPPPYGHHHPIYVSEPDPIIEIIVQDSNVTLPPIPKPKPTLPAPITPEPVHVFYVRYSNNNNKTIYGAASEQQNIRMETPVPAVSVKGPDGHPQQNSFSNHNNFQHYQQQQHPQGSHSQPQPNYAPPLGSHYNGQQVGNHYQQSQQQPQPQGSHYTNPSAAQYMNVNNQQIQPQSGSHFAPVQVPPTQVTESTGYPTTTTMRAIIRLDKNEYESNHLKVAFDPNSNPFSHLQHQPQQQAEASQQYQQVVPPQPQQNQPTNTQFQQYQQNFQQQQFQAPTQQQQQQQPVFQTHQNPPPQHQGYQNTAPQQQQQQQQFQNPTQFSSQLSQQFQSPQPQFQNQQQFNHQQQQVAQQSQQVPQYQEPIQVNNNFQFQDPQQVQNNVQTQNNQFLQNGQQQQQNDINTQASHQVAQYQVLGQDSQSNNNQNQQTISPSESDFNMDPAWTNWNQNSQQPHQQQQQQQPHQQQQQQQQQQFSQDQNQASSSNNNQQIISPPPQQTATGGYNPMINYGGGEPLGLSGLHAIGTENNMKFDNPIGLRPPPGPVYPKLGGFQKRIGLDDLATLLGEESAQQAPSHQQIPQQHTQSQSQQSQGNQEAPSITATYHDGDHSQQDQLQQQLLKVSQQLHQQHQEHQKAQQQQQNFAADQQEKLNKLPDDVPEELRQQLIDSGILGNAEVQVINYDQNLFKDLNNLPQTAIDSLQPSDDITKLLAQSLSSGGGMNRQVRNILVVNENTPSLRPKRKEESNKLILFIEDTKTLIYNVKKRSTAIVENKYVQNAIDYTHHKN